jgi:syntaxin 1B/2/3
MLRNFNDNVTRIGDLHSRSLNNMDDAAAQRNASQLDELVEETSALSNQLKRMIKALEAQPASGRDAQIRRQQVCPYCGLLAAVNTPVLTSYLRQAW